MAQLSNDCFAFGGALMSIDAAQALIFERLEPVTRIDLVSITEADGRVLAEPVIAPINLPPFDNSAVDGYAVRFADLGEGETVLPLSGRVAAGATIDSEPLAKHAVRIFTGAPMPPGFDTVFMQEDVTLQGEQVVLPAGLKRGSNRRLAGEDLLEGSIALEAGRRITPREIALLAGLGLSSVPVRRRLKVAIFSTGNEIMPPGEPLRPAALYDANRFMLRSMLQRLGCEITDLGILPDRPDAIARSLRAAADDHDLLITSGGVSTGEEDHVKAAVESSGALTFWRLAIKPGRPVAMGVVAGVPFIGLPGNPVAVFVTFVQIARVLVARLAGEVFKPPMAVTVRAGFAYKKKEGRREYVRVRLVRSGDVVEAHKHPQEGAGVVTSLTETDGLVELPESVTRVAPGDAVGFLNYAALL